MSEYLNVRISESGVCGLSTRGVFTVVVVDDDFMIGRVHQQYVNSVPGFQVVAVAKNAAETLQLLEEHHPDLLLLDIYLPDQSGIELMTEIRVRQYSCDVIVITAATELHTVEQGFRLGIFDYLVKPFNFELLGTSLRKYAQYKSKLQQATQVNQGVVEHLKKIRATELMDKEMYESGIDARTLEKIRETLDSLQHAYSSEEIAREAGVSRSTARTYLAYMVEQGMAEERLSYGKVGRPRRLFRKLTD